MASDLDLAKQRAAILARRIGEARVMGEPPASWLVELDLLRVKIETMERVLSEAEAGYRPVAVL